MKPVEKLPFNIGFPEISTVLMIPNKCGCTSISNVLKREGLDLSARRVAPDDLCMYDTAIAFMRDPFDRFLSCYAGHVGPNRHHDNLKYLFPEPVSVNEFAHYVAGTVDADCDIHFASQTCRFHVELDQVVMLPELDTWWLLDFAPALMAKGVSVPLVLPRNNRSIKSAFDKRDGVQAMIRDRFANDYNQIRARTAWQLPPWEHWK